MAGSEKPTLFMTVNSELAKTKEELARVQEKTEVLEKLLAKEIEKVAGLIKENEKLETELEGLKTWSEDLKRKSDIWRRYYEKSNNVCDRGASGARVIHGEIDISEILHIDK